MPTAQAPEPITTLRKLRMDKKLTIRQLFDLVRVDLGWRSPTTISKMENSGTQKVDVLRALSAAFSVPFEEVEKASNNTRIHGPVYKGSPGRKNIEDNS